MLITLCESKWKGQPGLFGLFYSTCRQFNYCTSKCIPQGKACTPEEFVSVPGMSYLQASFQRRKIIIRNTEITSIWSTFQWQNHKKGFSQVFLWAPSSSSWHSKIKIKMILNMITYSCLWMLLRDLKPQTSHAKTSTRNHQCTCNTTVHVIKLLFPKLEIGMHTADEMIYWQKTNT